MNLVLKAPFNAISGYGRVVDLFLKYFPHNGVTPHLIAMNGVVEKKYIHMFSPFSREIYDSCKQLVVFPMSFETDIRSTLAALSAPRPRVIYTMHETTQMVGAAVEQFNRTNGIIVPCQWNKETCIRDGISIPITVIPLGVDINTYQYQPPSESDTFVFGCGNGDPRKRLSEIVRCFCRAFHPRIKNVRLKVKISPQDSFPTFTDERVEVLRTILPATKLAEWYGSIDAFVSIAYAEGWGLMQNEAMACGRPLISPYYGGVKEFFDESVGFPIHYTEVLADGPYQGTGGFWADYSPEDLIEKMRWCYNNREEVHTKGKLSAERAKQFDEKNIVPRVLEVLKHI